MKTLACNALCDLRTNNHELKFIQFFPGHGWFTGEAISFDGSFYIALYSDGDSEEHNEQSLAKILLSPKLAVIDIDTEISLQWPSDINYYKATIIRERNTNKENYCVSYEEGSYEWVNLRERRFRLIGKGTRVVGDMETRVEVGSRVAFQWDDGTFYGATVTKERHGIFTLEFYDGDIEKTDFVGCEYRILRKEKYRTRFV